MSQSIQETLSVTVDMSLCCNHGQCEVAAPEVFSLNDEGEMEYDSSPSAEERGRVEQAVRICPAQAIQLSP